MMIKLSIKLEMIMKALVLESKGAPFVYKDVKDPVLNENEAVAKIIA